MSYPLQDTPTEVHAIDGKAFWVKREDLAVPLPGPPFSKVRGVWERLLELKTKGVKTVGYTETSISMAGWAIAWACYELGMRCVIFDPQYTKEYYHGHKTHEIHRSKWKEYGAVIIPIKAGMAKPNYYIGKAILQKKYSESIMLPLGLPFEETIEQTALQTFKLPVFPREDFATVVVCVGSGTICAGVLRGFDHQKKQIKVYGIACRETLSITKKRDEVLSKAKIVQGGMLGSLVDFRLIDLGWEYTDRVQMDTPFPCNPYYDAKALKWLLENHHRLKKPILFWNIGGGGEE